MNAMHIAGIFCIIAMGPLAIIASIGDLPVPEPEHIGHDIAPLCSSGCRPDGDSVLSWASLSFASIFDLPVNLFDSAMLDLRTLSSATIRGLFSSLDIPLW